MGDDGQSLSESNVVSWKELDWVEMIAKTDSLSYRGGLNSIMLNEQEKNIKARKMLNAIVKREVNSLVREGK